MNNLEKRMMQSPDLNKERLEKLKELFPDLFTLEGKLNPDEFTKIIDPDIIKETERFEFNWFGKSESKRNAFTPSKATFVYDESRSLNPDFADANMIIEGENLESLKVLLSAYREKIKCIYIDPPYNTGNDFVYSDKWDESKEDYWEHIGVTDQGIKVDTNVDSSGRFHSNWLNMLYPRLLIARQLLKEDGVIFISIDDNELYNLRKLCDEVFGSENFISLFTIKSNPRGSQSSKYVALEHEYLMMFSKNINNVENIGFEKDIEDSKDYDLDDGDEKKYRLLGLRQRGGAWRREQRPRMYYPIYINPKDGSVSLEKTEMFTIESLPKRPSGDESRWTWGKELFTKNKNKLIGKKVNRTGESEFWDIFRKDYLEDEEGAIALKKVKSIWDDKETNYQNGRNEIKELFGNSEIFDFPKPTYLVRKIISMFEFDNDIVLDFFSGSGTTAQAIIRLNYEDGENRKFILVQIPELTFEKSEAFKAGYKKISDITIERNKRVIEKIEKEDSEKDPSLIKEENIPFKTGFKVYKLAKSNFPRVDFASDPNKSDKENIKLLNQYIEEKEKSFFSKLDDKVIFDEVLLKNGFMLNYSLEVIKSFTKNKIYKAKDDFKECLICLDSEIAKQTLKELENHRDIIFICLERSLDTTMKWNLKHLLGDKLIAF